MSEHLEPGPGAIVQFRDDGGWQPGIVGYRWKTQAKLPDAQGMPRYLLTRVDAPDEWFQVTQAMMDKCGRLLVHGPDAPESEEL